MSKAINIFNEYYDVQEAWIRRQITDLKHDSFINFHLAEKEIEEAGITAFATFKSIDQFRDEHLSIIGDKKLSSSLRTHKKRSNRKLTTRRLDIDISRAAYIALESLVKQSGLSKIQIVEQLLLQEKQKQVNCMNSEHI